jgi:hypothetical protein
MLRLVSLVGACALLGCGRAAPPPVVQPVTAESFYSRVGTSSLICLKWPAGHAVVVWTDIDGFCGGGTGPCPAGVAYTRSHREIVTRRRPVSPEPGPAGPQPPQPPQPPRPPGAPPVTTTTEETGRDVNWRCETADGLAGRMTINGESFDLAKGTVFLVSTAAGGGVTQLNRDLSGLKPDHDSLAGLAKSDEAIREFVKAAVPGR